MYDFAQLSDYEFEQVVADLLGAEWQAPVEYFPRGRDGGVDLRVLGPTSGPLNLPANKELVVQCKHMPSATIMQLRKHLKAEAAKKIVSEAYRYVLVTSARLTRANKQEIFRIFAGRLSEKDIFGREDIDRLLRRHPEVVQANLKLWLASGTALQTFLNQVDHLRSNALRAELEQLRSRLVQTSVVIEAQQMLGRFGVCVLTGAPGVGKTTTAKILLLRYLSEGWQPVVAISDTRELEGQLLPNVKQLLYFDDFLGVTALASKLAKGDDIALVRLVHLIENDPTKALVLTTREYVLRQAQQTYEKLSDDILNTAKVTVNIRSLTYDERAHILHNQLYFSPLRSAAAVASGGPMRYAATTGHPNYNPRLIEAAIAAAARDLGIRPGHLPEGDYPSDSGRPADNEAVSQPARTTHKEDLDVPALLKKALDHPAQLWEHVLLHQLDELQRDLLVTRLSLGSAPVNVTDFLQVASSFVSASGIRPTQLSLDMALKVLDGDLLALTEQFTGAKTTLVVSGLQPGVTDSLVTMLHNYPDYLHRLTASACTFEQVRWFAEFLGIIDRRVHRNQMVAEYATELVDCAERNLTAPPVSMRQGLWYAKSGDFNDFGRRLEMLSTIYIKTGKHSTASFADKIVPQVIKAIANIPNAELVRILNVLQEDAFRMWQWRRGEVNVAALGQLDNPGDIHEWSLLRDALDAVTTTSEYREDLREQFEDFVGEFVTEAYDVLEEANEDDDVDLPLDELSELEDLADRWGVSSSDLDYLAEEFREIQDKRDETEGEQKRRERLQNQPTLWAAT